MALEPLLLHGAPRAVEIVDVVHGAGADAKRPQKRQERRLESAAPHTEVGHCLGGVEAALHAASSASSVSSARGLWHSAPRIWRPK
jgi:hypothetical protein